MKQEGNAAIVSAFQLVGKVAMEELTRSKEVTDSIGAYVKYIDKEKFKKLASDK
jgi:hypothetical protein